VGAVVVAREVTRNRELERQVAEQASQIEAIFEAMSDGMAVFDVQGNFVRANRALQQLQGFEAEGNITTLPVSERAQRMLLYDVQGQPVQAKEWPHWRVLRGEPLSGASSQDLRVRTLDGREIWISTTGAPIRGADGQVKGVVLITRDVTGRRALEQQVQEQASQLEAIFEAMSDGVFVLDAQGQVTRINPAAQALFQLATGADRAPEAIDRSPTERAHALDLGDGTGQSLPIDELPTARLLRGEILAGATAQTLQFGVHTDHPRSISLTGGSLRDTAGRLIGAVGVVRDVTELELAQAALAEQKRQYQTLVEHSPDVIVRLDPALRQVCVNPRAVAILGIPAAERLGKTYAELGVPAALYEPWEQALREVFATGEPTAFEITSSFGGGEHGQLHYYRVRYIPEFGAEGSVESVLDIATDITALKGTEQALREANVAAEATRQQKEQRRHEAERREEIAESLRGVLAVLNSKRSLQEVLGHVVRQVEHLLGSEAAAIYGVGGVERDGLARGALQLRARRWPRP
jgi:PAS domain S-box-containing protein